MINRKQAIEKLRDVFRQSPAFSNAEIKDNGNIVISARKINEQSAMGYVFALASSLTSELKISVGFDFKTNEITIKTNQSHNDIHALVNEKINENAAYTRGAAVGAL